MKIMLSLTVAAFATLTMAQRANVNTGWKTISAASFAKAAKHAHGTIVYAYDTKGKIPPVQLFFDKAPKGKSYSLAVNPCKNAMLAVQIDGTALYVTYPLADPKTHETNLVYTLPVSTFKKLTVTVVSGGKETFHFKEGDAIENGPPKTDQ